MCLYSCGIRFAMFLGSSMSSHSGILMSNVLMISYISSLLGTVWFLVIFYVLGGIKLVPHVLVGAVVASIFGSCIVSSTYDAYYKAIGLKDLFLASPLSSIEFRFGIALGYLIPTFIQATPYLILLFIFSKPSIYSVPLMALLIIVLWLIAVLTGYMIPSTDFMSLGPRISLVSKILTMIPPIYYPLDILPMYVRPLAYIAPTFNISELMKIVLGIVPAQVDHVLKCTMSLLVETIIILYLIYNKKE